MVTGHHKVGQSVYYKSVFQALKLFVEKHLDSFLTSKDSQRRGTEHDIKPKSKRHRRFRWKEKDQAQLLKLKTADVKMGTYKSCVACKLPKQSKSKDGSAKKPRNKRKMIPCNCGGPILH